MSDSQLGKKLSDETRKKMSEAKKGRIVSQETREKSSKIHKGRKHSEQSRRNMAIGNSRRDPASRFSKYSLEIIKRVVALKKEGMSVSQISQETTISKDYIRKILLKYGDNA